MRPRHALLAALTAVALLAPMGTAGAGGWWNGIDLDGQRLAVGESTTVRMRFVLFADAEAAQDARSGEAYYAYLVGDYNRRALDRAMRRANPGHWWEKPTNATRVGVVTLSKWQTNAATARVGITIPRMKPGRYSLMLCNAGCVKPLADVIPLDGVRIFRLRDAAARADLARVRAEQQAERDMLQQELQRREASIDALEEVAEARLQAAADSADDVDRALASNAALRRDIEQLQTELTAQRQRTQQVGGLAAAGWLATLLAAALLYRRRRRHEQPPVPPAPDRAEADDWELASR